MHPSKAKLRGMDFFKSIGSPRFVVAPMVEQSELAFRLLTRKYGAQLTYSPMIKPKLMMTNPTYFKNLCSVDPTDRPLIFQLGGHDPEEMVKAGKMIQDRCDAIDFNLASPQKNAQDELYGAFLLEQEDLAM